MFVCTHNNLLATFHKCFGSQHASHANFRLHRTRIYDKTYDVLHFALFGGTGERDGGRGPGGEGERVGIVRST